jgi:hypothetical protein
VAAAPKRARSISSFSESPLWDGRSSSASRVDDSDRAEGQGFRDLSSRDSSSKCEKQRRRIIAAAALQRLVEGLRTGAGVDEKALAVWAVEMKDGTWERSLL